MTDRLTLGYRTAAVQADSPLAAAGDVLKGHEFHYSTVDPAGAALHLEGRLGRGPGGFATPTMLASYLHLHLAGHPQVAERFVESATPSNGKPVEVRHGPATVSPLGESDPDLGT